MASTDRSLDVVAFVSEHFRDILRRRLSEIAGLALITLALLGAIALTTWSVQDPSLSHATQAPIHNLLGFPGAIFSDLAMQLLGLAAVLLLLPEALLGWRLLSHKPIGAKWRGLVWIAATFLAAGFASTLPRIGSWPLPTGLGGVSGDALLVVPAWIFGAPLNGLTLVVLAGLFGLATIVTLALAIGWQWPAQAPEKVSRRAVVVDDDDDDEIEEDETDDHASAWKGMIVHALLSWKARHGCCVFFLDLVFFFDDRRHGDAAVAVKLRFIAAALHRPRGANRHARRRAADHAAEARLPAQQRMHDHAFPGGGVIIGFLFFDL